jgi:hypothetical protein
MGKFGQLVRGHSLIVAATGLFFLPATDTVVDDGLRPQAAAWKANIATVRPQAKPKVTSKTDALQVEVWEPRPTGDGRWHAVLKNVSGRPINGYSWIAGGQWTATDLSIGDRALQPGAEEDRVVFILPDASPDLTILAAMFTDGSGNGDATEVAQAQQERSELKLQLSRGLALLNRVIDAADTRYANSATALDDLASGFGSLSIHPETRSSQGIIHGLGLSHGRQDLVNELDWLRDRQASTQISVAISLICVIASIGGSPAFKVAECDNTQNGGNGDEAIDKNDAVFR